MKNKTLDFSEIIKKYKGKWVVLSDDEKEVVSFGKSAGEALKESEKTGLENPILFKVPISFLPYVGGNCFVKNN